MDNDSVPLSNLRRFAAGVINYKEYKLTKFGVSGPCGDWHDAGSKYLHVEKKKFAAGGIREVFLATERDTGNKFVVKRYQQETKADIYNHLSITVEEHAKLEAQKTWIASYFTAKFNAASGYELEYLPVFISRDFEPVFIENFIDKPKDSFCKFVNNKGELLSMTNMDLPPAQEICEALVHFSLHKSKGYLMLCDVQGWFPLLTDPEVVTNEIGEDVGTIGNFNAEAIREFSDKHNCSDICKRLGLPRLSDSESGPSNNSGRSDVAQITRPSVDSESGPSNDSGRSEVAQIVRPSDSTDTNLSKSWLMKIKKTFGFKQESGPSDCRRSDVAQIARPSDVNTAKDTTTTVIDYRVFSALVGDCEVLSDITRCIAEDKISSMYTVIDLLSKVTYFVTLSTAEITGFVEELEHLSHSKHLHKVSTEFIGMWIAALEFSDKEKRHQFIDVLTKIRNNENLTSCHDYIHSVGTELPSSKKYEFKMSK